MESQRITTPKASRTIEVAKKKPDDTTPSITELLQQSKDPGVQRKASAPVIQRMLYKDPKNAAELVGNQWALQEGGTPQSVASKLDQENKDVEGNVHADPNFFTTVGFEFEFIQLDNGGQGTVLQNVIHAKLGESELCYGYTGLPFSLETDAGGSIELVTPPFIIDTLPGTSVPDADDVEKADHLMEEGLSKIVDGTDAAGTDKATDIAQMVGKLGSVMGIPFPELSTKITSENMLGPMSRALSGVPLDEKKGSRTLDWGMLKDLKVGHSEKIPDHSRPSSGIATQINIAMTTEDYQKMAYMPSINTGIQRSIDKKKMTIVAALTKDISSKCMSLKIGNIDLKSGPFGFLINEIAMYLINAMALPAMAAFRKNGQRYFDGHLEKLEDSGMESSVKDLRGVWLKDSVRSLAVDVFRDCDSRIILAFSKGLELMSWFLGFKEEQKAAAKSLASFLQNLSKSHVSQSEIVGTRVRGLCERGSGANEFDARPDTQLPSEDLPVAPGLLNDDETHKRLHVVESRHYTSREMVERLKVIKIMENCVKQMERLVGSDEFENAERQFNALSYKVDAFVYDCFIERANEAILQHMRTTSPSDASISEKK